MAVEIAQVQVTRYKFTVEQYEWMISAGILKEDERVELIRGEILEMAPIGIRHSVCVARLQFLLHRQVGEQAIVWTQNPILLPGNSQPEPDLALLRWYDDFYEGRRPGPEDALLLVEVSDTTLADDRSIKLRLYALAAIPEVWIVNLVEDVLEVYSNPIGDAYEARRLGREDSVPLPGELGGVGAIKVGDILG